MTAALGMGLLLVPILHLTPSRWPVRTRPKALVLAAVLATAAAALWPGATESPARPGARPAAAPPRAELSIMDDQYLIGASPETLATVSRGLRQFGVDRLRVSAYWRDHAPADTSTVRPAGFDATDHRSRGYRWDSLDAIVRFAAAERVKIMITITTPGPFWASEDPELRNHVWKPEPREFAAFAEAVADRYGSAVDQYGLMNEPNQGGWLQPQSESGRTAAPHRYREMVQEAYPRVKRRAPGSTVLIGELASGGRDKPGVTRPIRPLAFLRDMSCVNRRFRSVRKGPCRGFQPVPADAIGHHPYKFFAPPRQGSSDADDAGIGDTTRLLVVLDRLTARGALGERGRKLDVYYTEFGYQTEPPDPYAGIPLARQDRYLQEAAFEVWKNPRVKGINQFRLIDGALRPGPDRERYAEFQSGLAFRDGTLKPAATSFPDPFAISPTRPKAGQVVMMWGQVRPGTVNQVVLEKAPAREGPFTEVARFATDAQGYFARRTRAQTGFFRYRWRFGDADTFSSTLRVATARRSSARTVQRRRRKCRRVATGRCCERSSSRASRGRCRSSRGR